MKRVITFVIMILLITNIVYAEKSEQEKLDSTLLKDSGVIILCYHDIASFHSIVKTPFTVDATELESHIGYFLDNGFTFISLDDYIAINKGEKALPPKAIMLTFDDGYQSFYTKVFPLLKKYNVPATVAIIGSWMEDNAGEQIKMTTWKQFKEMEQSGLVQIVSHSYDLHKPIVINEKGDSASAAGSRIFRGVGNYETKEAYEQRILYDLQKAQKQFQEQLGQKAKALVWPFGVHTDDALTIAKKVGFETTFILHEKINKVSDDSLIRAKRIIINRNITDGQMAKFLNGYLEKDSLTFRLTFVKMTDVYFPTDDKKTDFSIDEIVKSLALSATNRVVVQAAQEVGADGFSNSVYFYNHFAPIQKDILSHLTGRFVRNSFKPYAHMPILNNSWLINDDKDNFVVALSGTTIAKVSPFDYKMREKLIKVFDDLATYSPLSGIYFSLDFSLRANEDFSKYAKDAYKKNFGKELREDILGDSAQCKQWSEWKTDALIDLSNDIVKTVKKKNYAARSMREIHPDIVLQPSAEQDYAQNYGKFLDNYDYVVIRADLYDKNKYPDKEQWFRTLATKALAYPNAKDKVVFLLPSYDASTNKWVEPHNMRYQTSLLASYGVQHFAYAPQTFMPEWSWYFPAIVEKRF